LILAKAIFGGLVAVVVTWVIIGVTYEWRTKFIARQHGITGLVAVTSPASSLLHTPLVIVLLTVAFGIGLYLAVR